MFFTDIKTMRREDRVFLIAAVLSAVLFAVLFMTVPAAHAKFNLSSIMTDAANQFKERGLLGLLNWLEGTAYSKKVGMEVSEELGKVTKKLDTINYAVETFSPVYSIFQGLGAYMVAMNLLLYLFREMQKPDPNEDVWFRFYIMYAISVFVIMNCDVIFDAINQGMSLLVGYMTKVMSGKTMDKILSSMVQQDMAKFDKQNLLDKLDNLTWGGAKAVLIETACTKIINIMLNCVTDGVIFSIAIKMVLRRLFAPIAIADMASEGFRSPGVMYMKRYAAYYLQEAIVVFTCATYAIMAHVVNPGSTFATDGDFLVLVWTQIAMKGAMCSVLVGSGGIASEILGIR